MKFYLYITIFSYICNVKLEKRADLTSLDNEKDKVQVFFRKQESLTCFQWDFEIATHNPIYSL